MRYMTSEEIREAFLRFFEKKGHKILPSASLIPDDPQLLFTVAGMVPFKPIFWGKVEPVYTRIATCQKCLRTVDIENVGKTPRHHTFFEMLGNFSFGDYFKEEAIEWAWEFLTQVLGVPEEKLWVSVYEEDEEAFRIWNEKIGLPERKILRMGKEDNFWGPAGPTGPCGPDTEIFYDTGYSEGCPDGEECTPANSEGRFVEIWNLVFTEYYQDEKGELHPLSRKNIDTGAGLERFCAMMQGVYSNFDTDLFKPIIERIEDLTSAVYKTDEKKDISIRVIADHIRAITFLISEGIFPSNEGRGYVLRRIIRRAMRHGILLGMNEPFLYKIVDAVVNKMGKIYPEIVQGEKMVKEVLSAEESRFLRTLEQGMRVFDELAEQKGKIESQDAFKLYDTYGLPLELTLEIAKEKGVEIDVKDFDKYMAEQQKKSRLATGNVEFAKRYDYLDELPTSFRVKFTGYEKLEDESEVVLIAKEGRTVEEAYEKDVAEVIFSVTPFYAEKGGQVADTGVAEWKNGKGFVEYVFEASEGIVVHRIKILEGKLRKGEKVILKVDKKRREATMRNHTATHLLHAALRRILGPHVRQAGSLVAPERLRFDFTHYKSLSKEEIMQIENLVNEWIMEAIPVEVRYTSYEEAVKSGVIALFTEKYGDVVRVVEVPGVSKELCGGTHVRNTGQIGLFKILSEESVSSGVRRIEAVTGFEILKLVRDYEFIISHLKEILGSKEDEIVDRVLNLKKKVKELEKKLSQGKISEETVSERRLEDGIRVYYGIFDEVDVRHLGGIADNILKKNRGIVVLFSRFENKVSLVVKVSDELTDKYNASTIARNIAKLLGGSGGGRKNFAQAGGKRPEMIKTVLEQLEDLLR
ncbi:alanine--tRNA ligase [Thermotoga sp. KOL6]|uniref:alanine--tRNA ligase n=1 Tax=Thermotoga sp. KOL6 TaxID=126741 RepID=UPI000C77E789|nr:alanine--tRNA ligase [Thermotoga sp. KOL6]PLV60060.1 alanine--tRNA ligase [Thermotoga sp. KOL6]